MILEVRAPSGDRIPDRVSAVAARLDPGASVLHEEADGTARLGDVDLPSDSPEWLVETAVLRALEPRHVLFLCVANSARSQLGEGLGRALAPAGVRVSSAGSEPTSVRPQAVQVLREVDIDISHHRSKLIEEVDGPVDAVITLCAEENCPLWLQEAWRVHWPLPDPAGAGTTEEEELDAFRRVRDELNMRLAALFQGSRTRSPRGGRS